MSEALPTAAEPPVCPRHAAERAYQACVICGDFVCPICIRPKKGRAYCERCVPEDAPLASIAARFWGALIDGLAYTLAGALGFLVGVVLDTSGPELRYRLMLLGLGVVLACNGWLFVVAGQSVGKRLVGTRIVMANRERVHGLKTLARRSVVPFLIAAIKYVGPLFSLVDALHLLRPGRRCLHDLLADTLVVEARASEHLYATSSRP